MGIDYSMYDKLLWFRILPRHPVQHVVVAALGSLLLAGTSQAGAQTPAAGSPTAPGEEVTVTARRRSEPLQRVPVAVSVFTAQQAARANLNDLQDILGKVPSADFRTQTSNKDRTIFIRGIGTISTSPGVEPSVSTVLDGVVLARSGQATSDLIGLDHIEVLRGPQGTLFGKNASAGAVNIVTAQPTDAFHAYADASYFTGDEYRLKGGVSGTLVENRLTGVIGVLASGWDGNVHDTVSNKTVNGYRHDGFRSKLAWTPTEATRVTLGLDYMRSDDTVPNGVFESTSHIAYPTDVVTGNAALTQALAKGGVSAGRDNTTINQDLRSRVTDDNGGASLTVEQKLGGGFNFTSITAWRRWHNSQFQDYDQLSQVTPAFPALRDRGELDFSQVSEEARIASPKGRFIDYVAGLYYLHADDTESYDRSVTTTATSNNGLANYGTTGNNYAVFGEGNVNLTHSLHAILGLRLLRDDLDYNFGRASTSPVAITGVRPSFASNGSTAHNGYVDRIGLQYDLSRGIMTYFTYSRGYKGPAYNVFFNMQPSDTQALKPETNNSFEIGLKSQFFNHRLTADFAAFISDFENYQANFLDTVAGATVTRLINAGSVTSRGVEGDLSARPIQGMTLGVAFAFDDAHIVQFNCPSGAALSCNVNGQPLPFAPHWKFDLRADYLRPVSDRYDIDVGSDYAWQSQTQYSLTETPDTIQAAYGLWDMNISLIDNIGRWRISAVLKNALNTHYSPVLTYGNLGGVVRGVARDDGRYGGFTLHKDF